MPSALGLRRWVSCAPHPSSAPSRAPFSPLREDGPAAFPERQGALLPTLFHPTPVHPRAQPGPEVRIYDASTGKLIRKGTAGPGPPSPPPVHAERPSFRYVRARARPRPEPVFCTRLATSTAAAFPVLSCLGAKTGAGQSKASSLARPAHVPRCARGRTRASAALHERCALPPNLSHTADDRPGRSQTSP